MPSVQTYKLTQLWCDVIDHTEYGLAVEDGEPVDVFRPCMELVHYLQVPTTRAFLIPLEQGSTRKSFWVSEYCELCRGHRIFRRAGE